MATTADPTFTTALGRPTRLGVWRLRRLNILYVVTVALAVVFVFPMFWAVMSALKTPSEMYAFPPVVIPSSPRPYNFVEAFTDFPFARWYHP